MGSRARYPSVQRYVDGLPAGWDSFPECRIRAELLMSLRARGALATLSDLDPPLQRAVDEPAQPGACFPEVTHVGVLLAVRDATFPPGDGGDTQFLAWMDHLNRDLFSSPEHAPVLASVETFLAGLPAFWAKLRPATPMEVVASTDTSAEVVQVHPRQLYPELIRRSHRQALVVALARAGAVGVDVEVRTDEGPALARTSFVLRWRAR